MASFILYRFKNTISDEREWKEDSESWGSGQAKGQSEKAKRQVR